MAYPAKEKMSWEQNKVTPNKTKHSELRYTKKWNATCIFNQA